MKPYYETELGKLYHGDCLEVMAGLEKESVDLILTDPPYGINYQSGHRKEKFDILHNDDKPPLDFIPTAISLLKENRGMYVYTRWDVYPVWYNEIEKYAKIKNCCIWSKRGGGMGDLKGAFAYTHEFCIYAVKGKYELQGKRISDVWEFGRDCGVDYGHPTQKPSAAMEIPLSKSTVRNDLVLDPFLGSGTTAIACEKEGRRWIGIEMSKEYCDIAVKRIEQERNQGKLF